MPTFTDSARRRRGSLPAFRGRSGGYATREVRAAPAGGPKRGRGRPPGGRKGPLVRRTCNICHAVTWSRRTACEACRAVCANIHEAHFADAGEGTLAPRPPWVEERIEHYRRRAEAKLPLFG